MPKVASKEDVRVVDDLLTENGLSTRLQVIIETNDGLENAYDIAQASPRIDALFFGGVDMAADLRCQYGWENLVYARSRVVHAAAGAMLDVLAACALLRSLADLSARPVFWNRYTDLLIM